MDYLLISGIKKYLSENGFTKEAQDINLVSKFAMELKTKENLEKLAADPNWKDILATGAGAGLGSAALGYFTGNEEDRLKRALKFGLIGGGAGGLYSGLGGASEISEKAKGLQETWEKSFDPTTRQTLTGAAIGALPGGLAGYFSAGEMEDPILKAMQYGSMGGVAGGLGGYLYNKLYSEPQKEQAREAVSGRKQESELSESQLEFKKQIEKKHFNASTTPDEIKSVKITNGLNKYTDEDMIDPVSFVKNVGIDPYTYKKEYNRDLVEDVNSYKNDFESLVKSVNRDPGKILLKNYNEGFKYYISNNIINNDTGDVIATGKDLFKAYIDNPTGVNNVKDILSDLEKNTNPNPYVRLYSKNYPYNVSNDKVKNFINKINTISPDLTKKIFGVYQNKDIGSIWSDPSDIMFLKLFGNNVGSFIPGGSTYTSPGFFDRTFQVTFNPDFIKYLSYDHYIDSKFPKYVAEIKNNFNNMFGKK